MAPQDDDAGRQHSVKQSLAASPMYQADKEAENQNSREQQKLDSIDLASNESEQTTRQPAHSLVEQVEE